MENKTISVELSSEEIKYLMLRISTNLNDIKSQKYKDDYSNKQLEIGDKLFDKLIIKADELWKK